jgi:hypothetical protein
MAKRWYDSNKYEDPWFRQLPPKSKLFWDYVLCKCDHAGVWKPDFGLASFCVGFQYNDEIINEFSGRIRVLSNGKWFIQKFVEFQYPGGLQPANKVHASVLKVLECNHIDYPFINQTQPIDDPSMTHTSPINGTKDKDKDKDKEILAIANSFSNIWDRYPKKLGRSDAERHYKKSVLSLTDIDLINKALDKYVAHIADKEPQYIKNGSSWFYQWRDWVNYEEPMTAEQKRELAKTEKQIKEFSKNVG